MYDATVIISGKETEPYLILISFMHNQDFYETTLESRNYDQTSDPVAV